MKKIILSIEGMSCSACSQGLEKYLNKQEGIISANVNLVLASALIEYEDILSIEVINKYVEEAGFKSLGIYNKNNKKDINKKERQLLIIYFILTLIIMYISLSNMMKFPIFDFLNIEKSPIIYLIFIFGLTFSFLIYGIDIFKSGFKNLIHKTPNMDSLVSIGVLSSFIYSAYSSIMVIFGYNSYIHNLYFESVSTIIFFIKLGRFIDKKSKEKTKSAIKELVQITPSNALLKDGTKVTIDEIKKGDILISKPGMKIAVDGVVVNGKTYVDESFINGESTPIKKDVGNKVVAGSINYDGYIEYKAEKIGKDSTISEIVRLVIEASNTKAPITRIADIVSKYFVITIISIAFLTLIGYLIFNFSVNEAITSFVTVLVVACPCALGLATPLAIIVSEGICAKKGILVKTSEALENVSKIDTVVFDKTGTLTYGDLKISKIFNYSNYNNDELLSLTSSLEAKSTHPISKAFLNYSNEHKLKLKNVDNFKNINGVGLSGKISNKDLYVGNNKILTKLKIKNEHTEDENKLKKLGNSIVYVVENKNIIGLIGVKDIIRKSSKDTISKLIKLNKNIIMLTGDNEITSKIIADSLNIKNIISNVTPKEKNEYITSLINEGKKVMMVGDGINDAISLTSATIGVSFNNSTDIAADSSDVILMNDDLNKIIELFKISKKTFEIIKQNLFWAFFYNVCMIPIAIGLLKPLNISMNPIFASISMTISSLTVVLNSLRLKK